MGQTGYKCKGITICWLLIMNAININAVLVAFLIYHVSAWTSQASINTVPCALIYVAALHLLQGSV